MIFTLPESEGWWKISLHEAWKISLHEAWYLFVFVTIFLILFFLLRNRTYVLGWLNIEDEEVISLRREIFELQGKIKTLEGVVAALITRIAETTAHMQSISVLPLDSPVEKEIMEIRKITRPVLLVYGDSEFGEQDRRALRRAGVQFFRLKEASLEILRDELHRRRSEGTLYDMVHISAHGNGEEILFQNGTVSGAELADTLFGVKSLFLATCKNQDVADRLLGIVQNVIVIYEDINTESAANFAYEFYKRYKAENNVVIAFNGALSVMPDVAEFVDLRMGGRNERL